MRARKERATDFDAVIKYILPFFYKLGFKKYSHLMAWEITRRHRVTPEVKAALRDELCVYNYQGVDYHEEEIIARMKAHASTGKSRSCATKLRAASVLLETSKAGTAAMKSGLGLDQSSNDKKPRTQLDYSKDWRHLTSFSAHMTMPRRCQIERMALPPIDGRKNRGSTIFL